MWTSGCQLNRDKREVLISPITPLFCLLSQSLEATLTSCRLLRLTENSYWWYTEGPSHFYTWAKCYTCRTGLHWQYYTRAAATSSKRCTRWNEPSPRFWTQSEFMAIRVNEWVCGKWEKVLFLTGKLNKVDMRVIEVIMSSIFQYHCVDSNLLW